ncbi:hypothetical protein [Primorskyibacter flagellatus]|uniref:hypothetical protein n=1 Tax=Primorskyibacter flagellatus TaxID=1387277 RepID=UPI003A953CC4
MAPFSIRKSDVIPEHVLDDRWRLSLDFPELGEDRKPKKAFILKQGEELALDREMLPDVFRHRSYLM